MRPSSSPRLKCFFEIPHDFLEVKLILSNTEVFAGFHWCFSNAIKSFLPAAMVSCLNPGRKQPQASRCLALRLTVLPLFS